MALIRRLTKDEVIENLEKAIGSYSKLIESNAETIDRFTRRIEVLKEDKDKNNLMRRIKLLKDDNDGYAEIIRGFNEKLKKVKERN